MGDHPAFGFYPSIISDLGTPEDSRCSVEHRRELFCFRSD